MIIVSACLAGIRCRYDGTRVNANEKVLELLAKGKALPVCPEQLGGLPTPRMPAEIVTGRVISRDGRDITDEYESGAREAARICMLADCREAILKSRSPSCGYGKIYDGSFSGVLTSGNGVFAQMLHEKGVKIKTEEDI